MKTAISLPDDLFYRAESLARRLEKPRSQIYAEALMLFLAEHEPDRVTSAWNDVCDDVDDGDGDFARAAARRTLEKVEW